MVIGRKCIFFWETSLSGKVFLVKELTFPGINNFYNRNNFPLKQLFLENQLLIVFDFNTSCQTIFFFLRIQSDYPPHHGTILPHYPLIKRRVVAATLDFSAQSCWFGWDDCKINPPSNQNIFSVRTRRRHGQSVLLAWPS